MWAHREAADIKLNETLQRDIQIEAAHEKRKSRLCCA